MESNEKRRRRRRSRVKLTRTRVAAARHRRAVARRHVLASKPEGDLSPTPTKRGTGRRHHAGGTRARRRPWCDHPDDSLDKVWKLSPTQVKERQRANLHRALARQKLINARERERKVMSA